MGSNVLQCFWHTHMNKSLCYEEAGPESGEPMTGPLDVMCFGPQLK